MEVDNDLKVLANGIIDSYEIRVNTINALMAQANQILKGFQTEIEEMIARLRENLAKTENLRKKDFDRMFSDVIERRRQREDETEKSLKRFQEEEVEMINCLRKIILSGNSSTRKDIETIKNDISKRQKEREKRIIKTLKGFQIEQEEFRFALKKLLSKGESVKIKGLRAMLRSLRARQSDDDTDLINMIEEFDIVRNKVQTQWQAVSRASG